MRNPALRALATVLVVAATVGALPATAGAAGTAAVTLRLVDEELTGAYRVLVCPHANEVGDAFPEYGGNYFYGGSYLGRTDAEGDPIVPGDCEALDLAHPGTIEVSLPAGYLSLTPVALNPGSVGSTVAERNWGWSRGWGYPIQAALLEGVPTTCTLVVHGDADARVGCSRRSGTEVTRVQRMSSRTDGTQLPTGRFICGRHEVYQGVEGDYSGNACGTALSADGLHFAVSAGDEAFTGTPDRVAAFDPSHWVEECPSDDRSVRRSIFLWDQGDAVPHRLPVTDQRYEDPYGNQRGTCPVAPALSADGRYVAFLGRLLLPWERSALDALYQTPVYTSEQGAARSRRINVAVGWHAYVFDRDPDANGVFDEAGAGRTALRLVGRPATIGSVSPDAFTDAWGDQGPATVTGEWGEHGLAISPDGRFVAWPSRRFTGNWWTPYVWSVQLHDRDADADGILDEPMQTATRTVPDIGTPAANGPTVNLHTVGNDGSTVLETATQLDPSVPMPDNGRMLTFAVRANGEATALLAPADGCHAGSGDCGAPPCTEVSCRVLRTLGVSPGGRYLVGLAIMRWSANGSTVNTALPVRLDRDADADGLLDEPGAVDWLWLSEFMGQGTVIAQLAETGDRGFVAAVSDTGAVVLLDHRRESPLESNPDPCYNTDHWERYAPGEGVTSLGCAWSGTSVSWNGSPWADRVLLDSWPQPRISADGRVAAIATVAPLVASDTNVQMDWYRVTVDPAATALQATLTTDVTTTPPGATGVDITDIPADRLRALTFDPSIAPGGTKVRPGGTKVRPGGTKVRPGGTKVRPGGTKVRDAGGTPLAEFATRLAAVPAARAAPLSQIGITAAGGWPAQLVGTPLAGRPLQSVTVGDLLDLLVAGVSPSSALGSLTMGDLDLTDSPLAAVSAVGLELGNTPVRALVTANGVPWCTRYETVTVRTCTSAGLPEGSPRTLMELDLDPSVARALDAFPVLRRIDVGANWDALAAADAPVLSTGLDDLNVEVTRLGSIDLSAAVVAARTTVGLVAVSSLTSQQRARAIVCGAAFDCATGTLAGALDAGALRPGALLADIDGRFSASVVADLGAALLGGILVDDVVRGRLDAVDFPWENLDLTLAGLQEYADSPNTVDVDLAITGSGATGAGAAAEATIRIPPGFRLDPQTRGGLAPMRVEGAGGGVTAIPVVLTDREYTAEAGTLRVAIGPMGFGTTHHLKVRVIAPFRLGAYEFSAQVRMGGRTATPTPRRVEVVEPTDAGATPGSAETIVPNRLVFGYFGGTADVDLFAFEASSPDQEIGVRLTNLGDDGDLALFGPRSTAGSQIGSRRVGAQPQPIRDLSQDVSAALQAADFGTSAIGAAGPNGSVLVGSSAASGATDAEQAIGSGVQYVRVAAFDRYAARRDPYMLRIRGFAAAARPACTAVTHPYSGTAGTMPDLTALPSDLATIILVAEDRLGDEFPASDVASLRAKLDTLAADPSVRGVVIPIEASDPAVHEGFPNVRGALDALEQLPCDVDRANRVVERLTALVDGIRTGSLPGMSPHLDLANVVVVGSDSIIPMARIEDSSRTGNEETYADAFDLGSPIGAALASRHFLSDAPYGDLDPIPWANRRLYIEDLAVGRLVETPQQIGDQIDAYLTQPGHALDPTRAVVASYDWMTSGASSARGALANALTRANGGTEVNVATLEDDWSAAALLGGAGSIGALQPTVTGLYMHADHLKGVSATGDTFVPTALAAALPVGSKFVFSMGCHAGLNDPATPGDFPEALAGSQAVYLASTGFGLGDDSGIQLHDRLVRYLAGRLGGTNTIGDALVGAKQDYFSTQGVYGDYDDKVLATMTLYGLPMYRIGGATAVEPPTDLEPTAFGAAGSGAAAPARRTGGSSSDLQLVAFSPGNGVEHATFGYSTSGGSGQAAMGGALVERTNADGRWFEVNGSLPLTVPGRPVQPRVDRDVTARRNGTLLPAHGALVTGLTEQSTLLEFDAAWARATIDATDAAPELVSADAAFPDRFATITTYSDRSGARTDATGPRLRQRLVVAPGRFVSEPDATPGIGTQTVFSAVTGDVLYSFSEDFTEPTVGSVDATVNGSANTASFSVRAEDTSGVSGVVVMVRDDTGWHRLDLDPGTGGEWHGGRPVQTTTGTIAYFVQVVDAAGNVATRIAKGAFTPIAPTPTMTAADVSVVASLAVPVTASVAVRLDRPAAGPVLVDWTLRDGTARVLSGDYSPASGTVRFEAGETSRTIEVPVDANAAAEGDEYLMVDLSESVGANLSTTSVRIDVLSPTAIAAKGISVSDASAVEGDAKNGTLRFVVSLDQPASAPVTVDVATTGGSATGAVKPVGAGVDYKLLAPKTLTFLPGQVAKAVSVLVVPDTTAEADETVRLTLSGATGATIGRATGTGLILDDDPVAGNPIRLGDASIVEGDTKSRPVFVTARFAAPLAGPLTVSYAVEGISATGAAKPKGVPGDFLLRSRTLNLRAGSTSFVIPITLLPDTVHEGIETLRVVVTTPTGVVTAGVTVLDDD